MAWAKLIVGFIVTIITSWAVAIIVIAFLFRASISNVLAALAVRVGELRRFSILNAVIAEFGEKPPVKPQRSTRKVIPITAPRGEKIDLPSLDISSAFDISDDREQKG